MDMSGRVLEEETLYEEKVDRLYALFKADKYEEVISLSLDLLRDNPDDWDALHMQARSFLFLRQYEDAEACIKQILAAYPNEESGLELMGDFCSARGEYDEAASFYEQCIEKNPEEPNYRLDLARALYNGRDPDNAFIRWPRARLTSEHVSRISKAINHLLEANQLRPEHDGQFRLLGQCYQTLSKPIESFDCYQTALVLNPTLAENHVYMAYHYINMGDLRSARSHIEQALMLDSEHVGGQNMMEILVENEQDPKKYYRFLVEYHGLLCSFYPKDPENWLRLVRTKLDYGKDHPVKELKAYVKLKPEDWEMQFAYGKVLYEDKRYFSAIRHFKQLDRLNPGNIHIQSWLQTLSNVNKAKACFHALGRSLFRGFIIFPLKSIYFLILLPILLKLQKNSAKNNK